MTLPCPAYHSPPSTIPPQQLTTLLKAHAHDLGFTHCGVARAERMDPEERRLAEWLNAGHHGQMRWMENHFDKRVDPTKLVPGAKTVVSLLYNYFPEDDRPSQEAPKISRYAYGQDYHKVIRHKLKDLVARIEEDLGTTIDGRVFVDSAPVLERDWARRAGVGWTGKNTLLIHPKLGSYYFLAEIISDLELVPDTSMKDYCGTCRACIEACPTEAISPGGYVVDGSKCISYLTIELKEAIPEEFRGRMEGWAFGCDICQEVCPWNRFATPHDEPAFAAHPDLPEMTPREVTEMTEEVFRRVFQKSAVKRTKFSGLRRNIDFLGVLLPLLFVLTLAPACSPDPPPADPVTNPAAPAARTHQNIVFLTDSTVWGAGKLDAISSAVTMRGDRMLITGNPDETPASMTERLPWLLQPGVDVFLYDARFLGQDYADTLRNWLSENGHAAEVKVLAGN